MAQTPFANPELKLETVTTPEETLIRCIGKLTYTSCEVLRSTVNDLLPQTKRLVLDLKDMTYWIVWSRSAGGRLFVRQTAGLSAEAHQCGPAGEEHYTNYDLTYLVE